MPSRIGSAHPGRTRYCQALQIVILVLPIAMTLGEKLRLLRHLEGNLRGLDRELTQTEVVQAIKSELKGSLSQSYLSLIENGTRPHLSNQSRQLLAKFFKVHPGYLVDDPPGFQTELSPALAPVEDA